MRPFSERPDSGGKRSKQCPIVAHDQYRALKDLDRVFQRFDRLDVQVIGRLVEDEQIGSSSIIIARATRARSPPERLPALRRTSSPEKSKRPRWP